MRFWQWGIVLFTFFAISIYANPLNDGVLRVCKENPRYFTNDSGRPLYLTGSHTWANLHERGVPGLTPDFDFAGYLDDLEQWGHNFIRLWAWEQATWMQFRERAFRIRYTPLRYERTGPGLAVDGKLQFDVRQWNEEYFQRLKQRVKRAGERGFYVGVMLFQGFSIEQKGTDGVDPKKGNPWDGHPFNAKNNINGIDG
ncbi:DUF4038 domain-containing protein, partial [bacterium]|nr:DUF4038 domain-containing protein [bacterium]